MHKAYELWNVETVCITLGTVYQTWTETKHAVSFEVKDSGCNSQTSIMGTTPTASESIDCSEMFILVHRLSKHHCQLEAWFETCPSDSMVPCSNHQDQENLGRQYPASRLCWLEVSTCREHMCIHAVQRTKDYKICHRASLVLSGLTILIAVCMSHFYTIFCVSGRCSLQCLFIVVWFYFCYFKFSRISFVE